MTGIPTEPKREAPIKYRDALVCSGTKCITESQDVMKEINRLDELGMVDPPLLPLCDGAGLFRRIQRDPVTSKVWCFGPQGDYRKEITNMFVESEQVKNCFALYKAGIQINILPIYWFKLIRILVQGLC